MLGLDGGVEAGRPEHHGQRVGRVPGRAACDLWGEAAGAVARATERGLNESGAALWTKDDDGDHVGSLAALTGDDQVLPTVGQHLRRFGQHPVKARARLKERGDANGAASQ
jgi:outer membrane lipoprotein SlyB